MFLKNWIVFFCIWVTFSSWSALEEAINLAMEDIYTEKSLKILKETAEGGNSDSQLYYGKYLLHHKFELENAAELIVQAWRAGSSDAEVLLQSVMGSLDSDTEIIKDNFCRLWPDIYKRNLNMVEPPVADATIIADYFVRKSVELGEESDVNPLKLQKLLYFSQTCSLQYRKRALLKEKIEAGKFGPFIYSIWKDYEGYGRQVIPRPKHDLQPSLNHLDEESKRILDETWKVCRDYSSWKLSDIIHEKQSPWSRVHEKRGEESEIDYISILNDKSFIVQKIILNLKENHQSLKRKTSESRPSSPTTNKK